MAKEKQMIDMPHSLEAEQALLGCLLLDARIQTETSGTILDDDFYSDSHRSIFHALDSIVRQNKTADLVTVIDVLEKEGVLEQVGGTDYLMNLLNIIPSSANYQSYLNIVKRDSTLRKLIRGSSSIIVDCQKSVDENSSLTLAEKIVYDISETADTGEMVKIEKILPDVMNKLDEMSKDSSASKGIRTCYRGLDGLLNGLHKSDLIVLAARPAVGKTSLAMNIVENIAMQGYSCAVFSLEMSKEQLTQRMLCSIANVSMSDASRGQMNKEQWIKITRAKDKLAKANIYINESSMATPREILSQCRRLKRKNGLDLVMIDYIQLMSSGNKKVDNRQQEISEISRNLKIMAKELNVPVIALSQLSRAVESRKGRPQLADLRESGAIEQDADIVMFIHRPDKGATEKEIKENNIQENVAEILVEKHRNGATGLVKLFFKGECTKFLNISEDGEPEDEDYKPSEKKPIRIEGVEALPEEVTSENDFSEENESQPQEKSTDDELFS